jgi:putative glycosyltransferase (TIGR04372 family)
VPARIIREFFVILIRVVRKTLISFKVILSFRSLYQLNEIRSLIRRFRFELSNLYHQNIQINFNARLRKTKIYEAELRRYDKFESVSPSIQSQFHREQGDTRATGIFNLHSQHQRLRISENTFGKLQPVFLDPGWTSSIGHLGLLSIFVRLARNGLLKSAEKVIVLNIKSNNGELLRLYSDYLNIVNFDEHMHGGLKRIFQPLDVIDTDIGALSLYAAFNYAIDVDQHSKLFKLPDYVTEYGYNFLKSFGFQSGDWFATVHIRETQGSIVTSSSNPPLTSYVPGIKKIFREGGWVVRIGHPGMTNFPEPISTNPRFIDFSQIHDQVEILRLFFLAECRFMIATESGPKLIPGLFGKPCLMTNLPHVSHCHNLMGMVIPQTILNSKKRTILTLRESLQIPLGWSTRPNENEFIRIPNSAEVISDSLDYFLGQQPMLESAVKSFYPQRGFENSARISPNFLDENPNYLE